MEKQENIKKTEGSKQVNSSESSDGTIKTLGSNREKILEHFKLSEDDGK